MGEYKLNSIEDAIKDFKEGKFVIVVDDEDRENEGDLIIAAEKIDAEKVNFMLNTKHKMARTVPDNKSIVKEFPMIFCARSVSLAPRDMENKGAPPMPNRLAKAVMIVIIGRVSPIPVKASVEVCGI